ncbi:MAG TPA: TAXI family TRAP transporter solute-binding subunit [Verrucomicrobiae bacterium]|jgi:TRAP-type uncharacterized transport system substrate-binding protein
MKPDRKINLPQFLTPLAETFGFSPLFVFIIVSLLAVLMAFAVFWFFHSAPPTTITITSGPEGSSFQNYAEQYRRNLLAKGIKLKIIPSQGSLENLQRLNDSKYSVDVGFVQVGVSDGTNSSKLMSLGSIAYQPVLIFYRSATNLNFLSDLLGKRLAIGPIGSGTRSFALTLLHTNGITGGNATLFELDAAPAAEALLAGKMDAIFLMGDSASPKIMRQLMLNPEIRIFSFAQADAYVRRITYLNKLELPMGTIDLGKNIPAHDITLIAPTVEILARPGLHPALSDLLLEAAQEVNGTPKIFQGKNDFPAALEYNVPLSPDATRFYKNGKKFLYGALNNFWLASLLTRIMVSFVPLVLILVPTLRAIPALYRWRVRMVLNRRYRLLLAVEKEARKQLTTEQFAELSVRLDGIEQTVNKTKVPASFADQFYNLRGHIQFVRAKLLTSPAAK